MQEKKLVLSYVHELPYVENKKQQQNYSRKIYNNRSRRGHSHNHNEAEKIKADYVKLCKQIKIAYGAVLTTKGLSTIRQYNNVDSNRVVTQTNISQTNKLIIQEPNSSNNKSSTMSRVDSFKKQLSNPSQFQFRYNNPFTAIIQDFQINGQCAKKIFTHHYHKFDGNRRNKKLRPLQNFLVKRLETDYLNVQKMKIAPKSRQQGNNSKSQSVLNGSKKCSKTENSQDINVNESFQRENQVLPIITSISKIAGTGYIHGASNLINHYDSSPNNSMKVRSMRSTSKAQTTSISPKKKKPFNPPFQTYFYRDLIWKVNFSNSMIIQTPIQYEHRLRVFVGRGNNGGLIRGLIKRRIWFAITQKIEDANFVWTQIKYLPYFDLQKIHRNQKKAIQNSQQKEQLQSLKNQLYKQNNNIMEKGILAMKESLIFQKYFDNNSNIQARTDQRFQHRNRYFSSLTSNANNKQTKIQINDLQINSNPKLNQVQQKESFIKVMTKNVSQIKQQKLQNHLINNYTIGNKKALLKTMTLYYKKLDDYVFNYLPFTFHIEKGVEDQNYFRFLKHYYQRNKQIKSKNNGNQQQSIWILKPGEYSNRGNGIKVCKTLDEIKEILKTKQKYSDGTQKTYIVQSYIEKPLLYNKRKFDLRHYMMITCINGILKGYWYRQGYVRTSSSQYTLATKDGAIHLTNDAIQKNMPDYGKYQKGNKISYDQLHAYLSRLYGYKNFNFKDIILPKMKKVTTDVVRACSGSIDPQLHGNNFEIFGLDFMIDADFNLWLIQVNTNPCLQLSCPLLANIIPKMVENALQLTVDAIYPPPVRYTPKGVHYLKKLQEQNKFDLIYDSRIDGFFKQSQAAIDARLLNEQEQTYQDEGEEWNQDD